MELLPIASLVIPPRQRQTVSPEKISELAASIQSLGLMHPVVVTPDNRLVAGERRTAAIKQLHTLFQPFRCNGQDIPLDMIPILRITNLDEIGLYEAELEENLRRENLTWQEEADALVALHEMREAAAESQGESQSQRATATQVAAAQNITVSVAETRLSWARTIHSMRDDKDVANAPSLSAAARIAQRKQETQFQARLQGKSAAKSPRMQLHERKFEDWLNEHGADCPDFSCIIADPPYGIGADQFGAAAENSHQYLDTRELALPFSGEIIENSYQLCGAKAHLFLFCDIEYFVGLRDYAATKGWNPQRTPLIWYKGESGHAPQGSGGCRRTYECILTASKGGRKFNSLLSDVIQIPAPRERLHAAEKPAKLYEHLLSKAVLPNEWVLDPCCGSGPVFPAARQLGLKAVGVEPEAEYAQMSQARINQQETDDA